MAAKAIQSGVDKIAKSNTLSSLTNVEMHEKAWRDIRNKLDSMLLTTNVIKGDLARKHCQALDGMGYQDRLNHIMGNWGPIYAERTKALLHQLEILEKEISKLKSA